MGKSSTIFDIANKQNISIATVSKALSNNSGISEITKKNVLKAADDLSYMPNYWAKNLVNLKSNLIGLIVPNLKNSYLQLLVDSLYEQADLRNFNIILSISKNIPSTEINQIHKILAYNPLGFIIVSENYIKEDFDFLNKKNIPIVFINPRFRNINFNSIVVDYSNGAYQIITKAINEGVNNLACFCNGLSNSSENEKFNGFINAIVDKKKSINLEWINYGDFSYEKIFNILVEFKKLNKLPEIIFITNEEYTIWIISILEKLNLKIGEDIDLIYYGEGSEFRTFITPYCLIKQPIELISISSINIIAEQADKKLPYKPIIKKLFSKNVYRQLRKVETT
ncbi:MAG: LacI family DNA-binding transcriptional regulator [Ignavibacteriae bacterium]|nr:LacI family DNA-binding transcriptional regulator [Ignavibacteriota bacterium]